jgi:hypothetical protein
VRDKKGWLSKLTVAWGDEDLVSGGSEMWRGGVAVVEGNGSGITMAEEEWERLMNVCYCGSIGDTDTNGVFFFFFEKQPRGC